MSNTKPVVMGVVVGIAMSSLVVVGWTAVNKGRTETSKDMADRLAALEDRIAALQSNQLQEIARPTAGGAAELSTTATSMMDATALSAEGLRRSQETTRKMEALWNQDGATPRQSAEIEQKLEAAARTGLASQSRFQPVGFNPACRASMCRVEGRFAAGQDGNDWATRMLLDMGTAFGTASTMTMRLPNGESQVVLYAFRPGREPTARR